jgi:hypothetical protein
MQQQHGSGSRFARLGEPQQCPVVKGHHPRPYSGQPGRKHLVRRQPSAEASLRQGCATGQTVSIGRPASRAMSPSRNVTSTHRSSPEPSVSSG